MVVTDDEALYRRAVALHDLGYARDAGGRLDTSDVNCQLWGLGARMSEMAGAMAVAQARKIGKITGAMRRAKWRIRNELADVRGLKFRHVPDPAGDTGPALITILPDPDTCERFVSALRAEGISGPPGKPLLPYDARMGPALVFQYSEPDRQEVELQRRLPVDARRQFFRSRLLLSSRSIACL